MHVRLLYANNVQFSSVQFSQRVEQFTGPCSRCQFETRLDKFWGNQDVMFDWTAEITGTEDRSEFKLETDSESTI